MEGERRRELYNVSAQFLSSNGWKHHVFDKKIIPDDERPDLYTIEDPDSRLLKGQGLLWWFEYYDKICEKTDHVYCVGSFASYMLFNTTSFGDLKMFIYCPTVTRDRIILDLLNLNAENTKKYKDPDTMRSGYLLYHGPRRVHVSNEHWFSTYDFVGPSYMESSLLKLCFVEPFLPEENPTLQLLSVMRGFLFDLSMVAMKDLRLINASWDSAENNTTRWFSCKMLALSKGIFPKYPLRKRFSSVHEFVVCKSKHSIYQSRVKHGHTRVQPCSLKLMAWEVCSLEMGFVRAIKHSCVVCGKVCCSNFLPI